MVLTKSNCNSFRAGTFVDRYSSNFTIFMFFETFTDLLDVCKIMTGKGLIDRVFTVSLVNFSQFLLHEAGLASIKIVLS